jgi:hypothetical protein
MQEVAPLSRDSLLHQSAKWGCNPANTLRFLRCRLNDCLRGSLNDCLCLQQSHSYVCVSASPYPTAAPPRRAAWARNNSHKTQVAQLDQRRMVAKTCNFLSSDRASERGQETPKRLAVRVRARALCAGVSIDGNMRPSINGSLYKIAHFDRADRNPV